MYYTSVAAPGSRHTPVIDSLVPAASAKPSDHQSSITVAIVVLIFLGVSIIAAMIIFFVRYWMIRAAIKRRRQASWILRSGQWNASTKRADAHEVRSGCSDASSVFSAYPSQQL